VGVTIPNAYCAVPECDEIHATKTSRLLQQAKMFDCCNCRRGDAADRCELRHSTRRTARYAMCLCWCWEHRCIYRKTRTHPSLFGRPLKVTVSAMLRDRCPVCSVCLVCLSCLFVMLVYCGQTVGWLKMPLGTEADLGAGGIVLDETQLSHGKGHSSPHSPTFRSCLLWPNGRPSQQLLSSC